MARAAPKAVPKGSSEGISSKSWSPVATSNTYTVGSPGMKPMDRRLETAARCPSRSTSVPKKSMDALTSGVIFLSCCPVATSNRYAAPDEAPLLSSPYAPTRASPPLIATLTPK